MGHSRHPITPSVQGSYRGIYGYTEQVASGPDWTDVATAIGTIVGAAGDAVRRAGDFPQPKPIGVLHAERRDVPDLTLGGAPKLVPLRAAPGFYVDPEDPNPVGMAVVGADGAKGGVICDIWVDQSEHLIRYYEVETGEKGQKRNVLLPANLARVVGAAREVRVKSILGSQFASVPVSKKPDVVTRLEEEKIFGFYGAGTLYATPQRAEPML